MTNQDPVLAPDQAREFESRIIDDRCQWDNTDLSRQPIHYYPHEGGWTVARIMLPEWLYKVCPKCRYQWALWKLGVPRE